MAAAATWEVLLNESYGISQQIDQSAHQALCAVYEQREQERLVLHHEQQQRYQLELEQFHARFGLQANPGQQYQQ